MLFRFLFRQGIRIWRLGFGLRRILRGVLGGEMASFGEEEEDVEKALRGAAAGEGRSSKGGRRVSLVWVVNCVIQCVRFGVEGFQPMEGHCHRKMAA